MAEAGATRLAVIGAGPIGLEMALGALLRGLEVDVFERASSAAGHVRSYHFVRLFSPWKLNTTQAGRDALKAVGVEPPQDTESFPTGQELFDDYLGPLMKALEADPRCRVHLGAEVLGVGRGALLKGESIGGGDMRMPSRVPLCKQQRAQTPFRLLVREGEGERYFEGFDFVADCTGSYRGDFGNWTGVGGLPAPGERSLRASSRIWSTIPDVLGVDRARFSGKRVFVIGAGMSAATVLRNLVELSESEPVEVIWATRGAGDPFTVIEDDVLPQRKALCEMGNKAARGEMPVIKHVAGAVVKALEKTDSGRLRALLETVGGPVAEEVDELVGCCGYRPDASLYSELQVHACYASDGPIKLAATLLGASGDCLKQVSAGADTLKSPEPGFFILGHKSYGRSSAFLLKIGHEQVTTILDEIVPSKM